MTAPPQVKPKQESLVVAAVVEVVSDWDDHSMSVSSEDTAERALLLRSLAGQRAHVLAQVDGLSEEQLRRPVLPSGWSCLGLVRHLTLSDERYWFEVVMAGEPLDFWPEGDNGDWQPPPDEPAADVVDAYPVAISHADEIIASRELDDPPARPED